MLLKMCIRFKTIYPHLNVQVIYALIMNTLADTHIIFIQREFPVHLLNVIFWYLKILLIEAEWRICVSKLTIIGSDNGLSPDQRQVITWTNAAILLIEPLGINFSEILIEIHAFSFNKMHLKVSSGKWQPSCLGPNVLSTVA